eukprot:gene22272-biopygen20723
MRRRRRCKWQKTGKFEEMWREKQWMDGGMGIHGYVQSHTSAVCSVFVRFTVCFVSPNTRQYCRTAELQKNTTVRQHDSTDNARQHDSSDSSTVRFDSLTVEVDSTTVTPAAPTRGQPNSRLLREHSHNSLWDLYGLGRPARSPSSPHSSGTPRHRAPRGPSGPPGHPGPRPPRPLGEQDSGAGVARAWRGRGTGYRQILAWGGAGVARAWRGRGAGMSCSPWGKAPPPPPGLLGIRVLPDSPDFGGHFSKIPGAFGAVCIISRRLRRRMPFFSRAPPAQFFWLFQLKYPEIPPPGGILQRLPRT